MIVGIISIKYYSTKKALAQMTANDATKGLWSALFADNSFTVEKTVPMNVRGVGGGYYKPINHFWHYFY